MPSSAPVVPPVRSPRTSLLALLLATSVLLPLPVAAQRSDAPSASVVPPVTAPAEPGLRDAPEAATGRRGKALARAERQMVAAAHPLAAQAGLEMLRKGGTAVDAAVATQLVLGLVEPQSSGIGGGAFLLLALPDGTVLSYDGRETAPAGTRPDRFIGADGKPMGYIAALDEGRAVGTPGAIAMLALAHGRHGKLPWDVLFGPAIRLAAEGYPAAPRLVESLVARRQFYELRPDLKSFFYRDGAGPPAVGETLRNPAYAETLRVLAAEGPAAFYSGGVGAALVERLKAAAGPDGEPATVTMADLGAYTPLERPPVCGRYRVYRVCGMGPPSAGGIAILQILGMLERFDLAAMGKDDPRAWHLMAEAYRRAYADREQFVADPEKVQVPVRGLTDPGYIRSRGDGIDPDRAAPGRVPAGEPPLTTGWLFVPAPETEVPATSHFSVVDGAGHVVAMTTTVEGGFGSGIMTGGFILNNQLTDFAFEPEQNGQPVANAPAAGKRLRSSMTPTLVFDADGKPVLTVGSPGGPSIIAYVAQALVAMLDWGLDPQAALDLPLVVNRNGPTQVEDLREADALAAALAAMGHEVRRVEPASGLHAIRITPDGLLGGADPRRDGAALGD